MSLDTLNNGDSGLDARTKINAVIGAVNAAMPTGTRITGYWDVAPSGYVLADGGLISKTGSYAGGLADDSAHDLFLMLYDVYYYRGSLNSVLLLGGTPHGPTFAEADWALGCTLPVPDERGRVPVMGSGGPGRTADSGTLAGVALAPGRTGGEEMHTLTAYELPVINPHTHQFTDATANQATVQSGTDISVYYPNAGPTNNSTSSDGGFGGGDAHNNVQPFIAVNVAIKL